MRKTTYYKLARLVPEDLLDPEISQKLDLLVEVANQACPRT